jgi:predicted nucleotidyltransferase component of viral defense system
VAVLPADVITAWAVDHPWPTADQVEQDLLLSQAICEIANDSYLGEELTFRGGTCLHKLHVDQPYRYSEDLDYARNTAGGIAQLTQSLTVIGERLGYAVRSRVGEHPKVYWRTTAGSGTPIRIKIEVNTHERSPALPHIKLPYGVDTAWWSGRAEVRTFQIAELVATKIRALYQRAKGRDVFDLWLALTQLGVDPRAIAAAFEPYRPDGWTPRLAEQNLNRKVNESAYNNDLAQLVSTAPSGFVLANAAQTILEKLIRTIDA